MKNDNVAAVDQRVIKDLNAYKLTIAYLAGIDTDKPEAVKAYFASMERNKTISRLVRAELARLRSLYLESYK